MEKLSAFVFVGCWLIIGLAVILCTTSATAAESRPSRNEPKTRGDWEDRRNHCVEVLKKQRSGCGPDDRNPPCGWISDAINWLSGLKFSAEKTDTNAKFQTDRKKKFQTDCSEELQTDLMRWHAEKEKPQDLDEFVNAYLKLYLNTCGLEKAFQQANQDGEQSLFGRWKSRKNPTLYDYVRKSSKPEEMKLLVSFIRGISELDGTSKEIVCTNELEGNFRRWLAQSGEDRVWREHVKDLFAVYLDKCGFEEQFKKVLDNTELPATERWTSELPQKLSNYFQNDNMCSEWKVRWILSAIEKLSEWVDMSQETFCTEEVLINLDQKLSESMKYPGFQGLLSGYLAIYFRKCGLEQSFRSRSANIAEDSDYEDSLYKFIVKIIWQDSDLIRFLLVIKKLSILGSISRESDCTEELKTILAQGLEDSGTKTQHVLLDYFGLYLEKCGFEKHYRKVVDYSELSASGVQESELPPTLSGHFKPDRVFEKQHIIWILSVTQELSEWASRPEEFYCTEEVVANLVERMIGIKLYPDFDHIVIGYFASYLQNCGLEQSFSAATSKWQQARVHPGRLFKFLSTGMRISQINWLLSVIMRLSKFESISSETDCPSELKTNMVEWLIESRKCQYSNEALKGYFRHYLVKCGFEEWFKKVINKFDQISGNHAGSAKYKTLFSYLVSKDWQQSELEWILSAMEELSELASVSQEADCTKELVEKLMGMLSESKDHYPDLHVLLGEYQKFYKNLCGPELKGML